MKIAIGADHRGFGIKELIKDKLSTKYEFVDVGAREYDSGDDYTVYAIKVAEELLAGKAERGILICGSGVGVCVAANKYNGIRAAIGVSEEHVKAARNDDDINVLCLAADIIDDNLVPKLVQVFVETDFSNEERHIRRLEQIKEIENSRQQ